MIWTLQLLGGIPTRSRRPKRASPWGGIPLQVTRRDSLQGGILPCSDTSWWMPRNYDAAIGLSDCGCWSFYKVAEHLCRPVKNEDASGTNIGHKLTQDIRRWKGKDTPPSRHALSSRAGPQDYLMGTPTPPPGSTSPWSPSIAWATNHHRSTWTRKIKDSPLGRPVSEARSWKTFTSRFHPHVSQSSSTIFEGVGTSSRRFESGDRSGETIRPENHPTYFQRSIFLIEGDKGQDTRRFTSKAGCRETLRPGSHPTTCQHHITVIWGDRKNPRPHESETRFRGTRRSGSHFTASRDSPVHLRRSKSSTRRGETPNEGSHPTSRRPVRRDRHSAAGLSSSNTW